LFVVATANGGKNTWTFEPSEARISTLPLLRSTPVISPVMLYRTTPPPTAGLPGEAGELRSRDRDAMCRTAPPTLGGAFGTQLPCADRVALQNTASIASLLLTTEALVTDIPEEKSAATPAMPHGDMY
jgi:hypothetical protein